MESTILHTPNGKPNIVGHPNSNIPESRYGISQGWRYAVIVIFGSLLITAWIYNLKGLI